MAILGRLAFDTPVHLDQVRFEGIEHLTADDMAYASELGLGLKLIGTAERVDGGVSVRVHPAFLYGGHPLATVNGPFNAVTVESPDITEITMSGLARAARRPRGPCSATSYRGEIPPASTPETTQRLRDRQDVVSLLPAHGGRRPPRLCGPGGAAPGHAGRLDQVGRAEGPRNDDAPVVMVVHPLLESPASRPFALIGQLDFMRSAAAGDSVIEEEFTCS